MSFKKTERRETALANIGASLFYLAGIHPTQGKYGLYLASFLLCLEFVYLYLIFEMLRLGKGDLDVFIDGAESVTIYFQGFGKIPILFYKNDLLRLLNDLNLFWDDPNDLYLQKLFTRGTRALKIYRNIIITASWFTLLTPYFSNIGGLSYHIPDFPYAFMVTHVIQTLHLTTNIWYVLGVDVLFAAICINIIGQFHLLHKTLSSLGNESDEEFKEKIAKCIKHHDFLTNYSQHLNKTYGLVMFAQYLLSMYTVCLEIYKLADDITPHQIVQCIMIITSMSSQLAIYCFPAYEITILAEDTAEAMYQSCWYNRKPTLQKSVGMVIVRARQKIVFTGLGIMEITRETYLTIFKSALSFYTFLKQMKTDAE